MAEERYDAIVIGAGQGGGPFAGALAQAGRRTALVERAAVGGSCVNWGCTPTKTMVASARAAYLARRGPDYGVRTGRVSMNMGRVRQRKRAIVDLFRDGSQSSIESTPNLDLIFGDARFTASHTLAVRLRDGGERALSAELIVIDTGQRPALPPIPGLAELEPLDSMSIMELDYLPEHLAVLGGGYIGVEFAQMFRRFGSAVTLIERESNPLAHEDEDVCEAVAGVLRQDGIVLLTDAEIERAERAPDGRPRLTVRTAHGARTITASHILAAAGQKPNTDGLNLGAAGVKTNERGYITVNERLETNVADIYAIGDCNGEPAFTHISYDDYRILTANLLQGGNKTTTGRLVPYTVFIDPQLGRVGLSEKQARAEGRHVKVAKMDMDHVARALEVDEPRGFLKVVLGADGEQILGCAMLGMEGGELMSMIQLAMLGHVPASQLHDAIFAHPTLAESLNNLFAAGNIN
jgi:pyruvate/2-oxoglutarate dehydrogenase complex dihydrolipoamide dehydrogenase (E3) component